MTLRRDIKVDAVFDIETQDWDTFVSGGILRSDNTYSVYCTCGNDDADAKAESALVDAILAVKGNVWAHFGGGFDFKWLLDHVAARGLSASIAAAGSRIISATISPSQGRKHATKLYDSWALCPISLSDLTKGLGIEKSKLDLPCICGEICGGFCSIKRKMPQGQRKQMLDYMEADCRSLMLALDALQAFAETNDLDLGATIGGSAWKNVQRRVGIEDADTNPGRHMYARQGYYGGRVQVFRAGNVKAGYEYDVRSMYPWALATFAVPTGNSEMRYGSDAQDSFDKEAPGIYQAAVEVPEMHIPPLPFRHRNRIHYPTGKFIGTWAYPELRYAEKLGVKVKILSALVWESEQVLFAAWIERLFALRFNVGTESPIGQFLKLYMNSLTGKFGMNPERYKYFINPSKLKGCPGGNCDLDLADDCGKCCDWHCSTKCGATAQISESVYREYMYSLSDCCHVEWSAYLTAHSRVHLHRQLVSGGLKDAVYCDTDSVFCENPRTDNVGEGLGQFEFKCEFRDFLSVAPKVYEYTHVATGKRKQKAKGIKRGREFEMMPGKKYYREGIAGFTAGTKLGRLFSKIKGHRTLNIRHGDRFVVNESTGETRAPRIDEVLAGKEIKKGAK